MNIKSHSDFISVSCIIRMIKMKKWRCLLCDFVYDEEKGIPDQGIVPGTRWEDIPNDWVCPDCDATKKDFVLIENQIGYQDQHGSESTE
jgi:rubredoxin